ncbi:FAD-binding oxidoreductase (plasmid) [Bosea sp. F3-2]|uniref:NAD(P)/FAD-dependent oxidoreductase n=1 Tax=Bosea sp. F3-2 TaxID=2599640 RepID=UPI0011EEC8BA|nr:FAD-binding oxidoreductase [Bosea sp. F3-2]QEL27362.1 FAD-binding oxidoreductase [Bosea sp. F3-2]
MAVADSQPELPEAVDTVVIGGGIIGAATAYYLADRGYSVALCEKGRIGAEQSGRNQGWCRVQKRAPGELPLILESMRIWKGLDAELQENTGFTESGILTLYRNEHEAAEAQEWLAKAQPYQLDIRMVSGKELAALVPGAATQWKLGLYSPGDGRAEPALAAPAYAKAAARKGASILTNCAVRGIETTGGRVSGAVTERGTIRCSSIVLAGGVWSTMFCRTLGIRLPQLKTMSSLIRTGPIEGGPSVSIKGPDFSIRKRLDGGYTIGFGAWNRSEIVPDSFRYFFDYLPMLIKGENSLKLRVWRRSLAETLQRTSWALDEVSPFEKVRVLDPTPSNSDIASAIRNIRREFPIFDRMTIAHRWAGLIDVMPDTQPVISQVASLPGFYISSGYSGHGFGIGPAAGRLTADLVDGTKPLVDLSTFRLQRFRKAEAA